MWYRRLSMQKFGPWNWCSHRFISSLFLQRKMSERLREQTWAQASWPGSADHSCSRGGMSFSSQVVAGEVGQKQGFTCTPHPCDPSGKRDPLKHTHSCCKLSGTRANLQGDTGFQFTPKRMMQLKWKRQCLPVQANCKNPLLQWAGLKVFSRRGS